MLLVVFILISAVSSAHAFMGRMSTRQASRLASLSSSSSSSSDNNNNNNKLEEAFFKGNPSTVFVPMIRPGEGLVVPEAAPVIDASIKVEGALLSFDLYTCQPETQTLVIGQIANWAKAERYALGTDMTHSVVFGSVCGRRVWHSVGWKIEGMSLFYAFEDFKKRADGKDGSPASLKESTHMYRTVGQYPPDASVIFHAPSPRTQGDVNGFASGPWGSGSSGDATREEYPFFTIDVYTCRKSESQEEVTQLLRASLKAMVPSDTIGGAPHELLSMHVLRSTDPLALLVISAWTNLDGPKKLLSNEKYMDAIKKISKLAAFGSLTDYVEKSNQADRAYFVADVIVA